METEKDVAAVRSARVQTATMLGPEAFPVDVETQLFGALRRFSIVGLPDGVVRESKERVRCAIENSGIEFPELEVIVHLGPAALPKLGAGFDLAIALSILAALGEFDKRCLSNFFVLGELALSGQIKSVAGALLAGQLAKRRGARAMILSEENAREAVLVRGLHVHGAGTLQQVLQFLRGERPMAPHQRQLVAEEKLAGPTFDDVIGQHSAKRALEIAAAGGHNALLSGPPGSGKSMLAERFPSILPALDEEQQLEVSAIHSLAARAKSASTLIQRPPFRAPHHSTSVAGLVGGGAFATPGELSLAHHGVLFLDELPEFRRDALEALRQPLEKRSVSLARARLRVHYPARFILLAAMNPCPCGKKGLANGQCSCTSVEVRRYLARISGPILDRIDLQLWVPPVPVESLDARVEEGQTAQMIVRVQGARERQRERFGAGGRLNAAMTQSQLQRYCELSVEARAFLNKAAERHQLSARGYMRVLKLARTIADLEGRESITTDELAEAASYRMGIAAR